MSPIVLEASNPREDLEYDLSDEDTEEEEVEEDLDVLDISEKQAVANLNAAGSQVTEESDRISVKNNRELMDPMVDKCLDDVVSKLAMPYAPSEFQRVSVNALGQQKNVILVSPTGSGKMNVPLLAILVLRERMQNPKGVAIITQPLTSIMNEKKKNDVCPVAVLSMSGHLSATEEPDDAKLSCLIDDLLDGKYPVLIGHPESFDTPLGQRILRELQRREMILLLCIDEFHQCAQGNWETFRFDCQKNPAVLKLQLL